MSMKATISKNVDSDNVIKRVSNEFKDIIDIKQLTAEKYTVVCFPSMKSNSTLIVNLKNLERALKKIKTKDVMVIIGHNFTIEALSLIDQLNILIFRQSSHHWSDESLASIGG